MPEGWINFTFVDDRMYEQISLAERWATIELFRAYYENRLDAIIGFADNYGQRFHADVPVTGKSGRAIVRTGWILLKGESAPRLTTCFVKS